MRAVRLFLAAAVALAVSVWVGSASSGLAAFAPYASGFDSPVYVTSAPGDPATLYVVEQPGTIKIVRNGSMVGTFLDIRSRIKSGGEQGLLSVAFHPQYETNHRFYVDYTDTSGDTRVVEFRSSNPFRPCSCIRTPWAARSPVAMSIAAPPCHPRRGATSTGTTAAGRSGASKQGTGRLSAPTGVGSIKNLSSFGEDGNGELYATSLDGSLYRLR